MAVLQLRRLTERQRLMDEEPVTTQDLDATNVIDGVCPECFHFMKIQAYNWWRCRHCKTSWQVIIVPKDTRIKWPKVLD